MTTKRFDLKNKTDTENDELVKVKDWLFTAERSTTETEWRETADEDYRFYAGDQDSTEVIETLRAQRRPITTHNECKPKVDMLVGLAAQTKYQPTIIPVGLEDEPLAELMNGVYKFYVKKIKLIRRLLECFEHTVKSGRSLLYFYIDKQNPFEPEIKTKRIDGRNFILDPESVEYDMSDARYIFIDSWLSEDQIKAFWPDFDITQASSYNKLATSTQPVFFNEDSNKYRIIECWYRTYTKVIWFVNPMSGKPESLEPEEFKKFTKILVAGDEKLGIPPLQTPLQSVGSIREDINYIIFSGDTKLEGGRSPYKLKGFPCALLGAYKNDTNNSWFGVITTMKDPQKSKNAMIRQLSHLLQTLPKGILVHEVGVILNIEEYEEKSSSPNFHLEVAQGGIEKFKFMTQPQISPIFIQLEQMFSQSMKDTSGIQDTLMGVQTSSREPGVTVAKRQETGLAVLYTLFDNFASTRFQAGQILLSLIQQYVAASQVIRIEGPDGMQLMQINTQSNRDNEGFNDISAGEFDLVVDETIETASSRMLISQILTDFSHNNPGSIPPDVVLDYANVPYTVKQRVKQTSAAQQQQQQDNVEEDRKLKLLELQVKADAANASTTLQRDIAVINANQAKQIAELQAQQKQSEAEMKMKAQQQQQSQSQNQSQGATQ
jgi:hypothetical protein